MTITFPSQQQIAITLIEQIKDPWFYNNRVIHKVSEIFAKETLNEQGVAPTLAMHLFDFFREKNIKMSPEQFVPIAQLLKKELLAIAQLPAAKL